VPLRARRRTAAKTFCALKSQIAPCLNCLRSRAERPGGVGSAGAEKGDDEGANTGRRAGKSASEQSAAGRLRLKDLDTILRTGPDGVITRSSRRELESISRRRFAAGPSSFLRRAISVVRAGGAIPPADHRQRHDLPRSPSRGRAWAALPAAERRGRVDRPGRRHTRETSFDGPSSADAAIQRTDPLVVSSSPPRRPAFHSFDSTALWRPNQTRYLPLLDLAPSHHGERSSVRRECNRARCFGVG
jgi:hypothetical protein